MSTDVDVDEHGIVRDGGRVRVPVMLMDSADALMRREFPTSHGLADVALCRPGFRTSSTRLNARDEITDAYQKYDQVIRDEWRKPNAGRDDPAGSGTHELYGSQVGQACSIDGCAGHLRMVNGELLCVPDGRNDALPRQSDGRCPHCGGSGIAPGHKQSGWIYESDHHDDDDDDKTELGIRQRTQRRYDHMTIDELRSHHADTMRRIYEDADTVMAQLWRCGK